MTLSPLRYPGGKSRAVKLLSEIIPETKTLCSPFFGGGSFELHLANKGTIVYGYDCFDALVDFWENLLNNKQSLVSDIRKYHPMDKETFYSLQKTHTTVNNSLERAVQFFVLNRSSFSGTTLSGGMSPGAVRFTESSIKKLENFSIPNFTVKKLDFTTSIPKHKEDFVYADPPYMIENTLYGVKGNTHKGFDHDALFDILDSRDSWILSYNNCSKIQDMYSKYKQEFPNWKYGMSKDKDSKEILIYSKDLK